MSTALSTNLIRNSGITLMIAGALTVIGALLHPNEVAHPEVVVTTQWLIAHSCFLIATTLSLFGLTAHYLQHAEQTGIVGRIGYVLAFVSTVIFTAIFAIESFIMPVVAANPAGAALLDVAFNGLFGLIVLTTGIAFSVGYIVIGLFALRFSSAARWGTLLLIVGGPLAGFAGILPYGVSMGGIVVLGLGFLWLGWRLQAQPQAELRKFQLATA